MRKAEGVFVVEGTKLLHDALRSGIRVESVYVAGALDDQAVRDAHSRGIRVVELEDGVMERISDTVTPQPVMTVVETPAAVLDDLSNCSSIMVLVDVRDPGNAGTIIRSAEASGIDAVVFVDQSVDPYNPKTVRSTAGAIFYVPVVRDVGFDEFREWASRNGFPTVGTAMEADIDYDEADLTGKVAIVVGNEANGLSPEQLTALDRTISIPMQGRSESLNVSMAASIVSFELARQRRSAAS